MSIASKEARETLYWIRLLKNSGYLNEYSKLELLDSEICSIVKIITSIVKTTQNSKLIQGDLDRRVAVQFIAGPRELHNHILIAE